MRRLTALGLIAGLLLPAASFAQDIDAGRRKAEVCFACHGVGGQSAVPAYPVLAGQTARYLYLQLKDFKEGRREEPQMSPFVKDLSRQDMLDLAAYFAAQPARLPAFKPDPEAAARGQKKAEETLCTMCHLGGFKGQNEIPRVAGQHYDYIVKQLADFKAGHRTNDAGNMASVSKTLSEQDMRDLGHYLVGLQ